MKLRILSDLHNEFGVLNVEAGSSDAVILAGDIDLETRGAAWALRRFAGTPVIYVAGNHEYYGSSIEDVEARLTDEARAPDLYFLQNRELILGGVRFLGCTLWSDFLFPDRKNSRLAAHQARMVMNDYRRIQLSGKDGSRCMMPADSMAMHAVSKRFLARALQRNFAGPTAVITHHLPTPRSLYACEKTNFARAAYCSDMEDMITAFQPELWVHGHRHLVQDYYIGGTRILCNPRGYAGIKEAEGFDPDLTIEL